MNRELLMLVDAISREKTVEREVVFGAVLGTGVAFLTARLVNQLGLSWIPPTWIEPVPLSVRLDGEYAMVAANAVGLVVVASLSSLLPAARAARMNIVDALRHV